MEGIHFMDVAERIIKLRIEKKYSANKLSKLAGIGQSTLNDIERGLKQPTIPTLENICIALGITLAEFFSFENEDLSAAVMELTNIAKKLPPNQVDSLISVAKAFLDKKTEDK
jgi:transcriptional regulator with XRE-family HTH domain